MTKFLRPVLEVGEVPAVSRGFLVLAGVLFWLCLCASSTAQGLQLEQTDGELILPDAELHFGFGEWKQNSAAKVVVIRNTSGTSMTGVNVEVVGADSSHFSVTPTPEVTLAAGDTVQAQVYFRPIGAGSKIARLKVSSDGNPRPMIETGLTGIGRHQDESLRVNVGAGVGTGSVRSAMALEGGDLLIAGAFGAINQANVPRLCWLDGTGRVNPRLLRLDATVQSNFNNGINGLSVRPGLGVMIGGHSNNTLAVPSIRGWHLVFTKTLAGGAIGGLESWQPVAGGFNNEVLAMATDAEGRFYMGGRFTESSGDIISRLDRTQSDSNNRDATFGLPFDGVVGALCGQSDGKMLVGGNFLNPGPRLLRLGTDGQVDGSFQADVNGEVTGLLVVPDGDIILAGNFSQVNGQPRGGLARIHSDGSLDESYSPQIDGTVHSMALQADGRLLLGGAFTEVNGTARLRLARLLANGDLDSSFDPGANGVVWSVSIQPDGGILVGGDFTLVGGVERNRLARLPNDPGGGRGQPLVEADGTIVWPCGGSAPELSTVVFHKRSQNGAWVRLDMPVRTSRGWELTGADLAGVSAVRVRGLIRGGFGGASEVRMEGFAEVPGGPGFPLLVIEDDQGRVIPSTTGVIEFGESFWPDAPGVTKRLTLRNLGTAEYVLHSIRISGGTPLDFSHNFEGPQAIPAGESTSLDVTFQGRQLGGRIGALTFVNSTTGYHPEIALAGTASERLVPIIGAGGSPGSQQVKAVLETVDDRIWIGGDVGLARFFSTGEVDLSPAIMMPFGPVECAASLPDGSFLYGGSFGSGLTKLGPNRTTDFFFQPQIGGTVLAIDPLPDGRILIGGGFVSVKGIEQRGVAILDAWGGLDRSFRPVVKGGSVRSVLRQQDGKVLITGEFTEVNGVLREGLVRLNPNGTTDSSFSGFTNSSVEVAVMDLQGRIVIGGNFMTVNGVSRSYLARLNTNGQLDESFAPELNGGVSSIVVQENGELLLGGDFTRVNGSTSNRVHRLKDDGSRSSHQIISGANARVTALALQRDGRILAGGAFTNFGGLSRVRFARWPNAGPAISALEVVGTNAVLWRRGGSAGALSNVTIESWGGSGWRAVGLSRRTAEGWSAEGNALPTHGLLRARGWRRGSRGAGSAQFEEHVLVVGAPSYPQMQVEVSEGSNIRPGRSLVNFGSQHFPVRTIRKILVTNTGAAPLSSLKIVPDSGDLGDFKVSQLPGGLAPGRAAVCTVTFNPKSGGSREARFRIESNAAFHNPWEVILFATSLAEPATADMVVESGEGRRLTELQTITVGRARLTGAVTGTLVLRNVGKADLVLGSIGVGGDDANAFQIGRPRATTVAPGKSTTVPITLNPVRGGEHRTTLTLGTNIPGRESFTLGLLMFRAIKAEILTQPQGQLLALSEDLNLSVGVSGVPVPVVQWFKDGKAIRGGNQTQMTMANVGLDAGGIYTCRVTQALEGEKIELLSRAVGVGVFETGNRVVAAQVGKKAVLQGRVNGPVALGWIKDESTFFDGEGRTLTFDAVESEDEGEYQIEVSMAGQGSRVGERLRLRVFDQKPVLLRPIGLGDTPVLGGRFEGQVQVNESLGGLPTLYSARGLPPGLRIDSQTGRVTGVATEAKPGGYSVQLSVSNSLGRDSETFSLAVIALPENLVGNYEGVLHRAEVLDGGLGGFLSFEVTKNAGISGNFILRGSRLPFRGQVEIHPTGGHPPRVVVPVKRKTGEALRLLIEFNPSQNRTALASLANGSEAAAISAWRNRWASGQAAEAYEGQHTFTFGGGTGDAPRGFGSGSIVVNSSGRARIAGWTPDGLAYTNSRSVGPEGEVGIYAHLYSVRHRGSLLGILNLSDLGLMGSLDSTITGHLDQWRPSSTGRLYPQGFGPLVWTVEGGGYAPGVDFSELSGPSEGLLALQFSGAGSPPVFVPLDLLPNGSVSPLRSDRHRASISLNQRTGFFVGSYEFMDVNPLTGSNILRKALYRGVFRRQQGEPWAALGFHLLPDLPSLRTTSNPSETGIRSGPAELNRFMP